MGHILILDRSLASLIHYCPACGALTRPAPDFLTMAELEVLGAVGQGLSTNQIADRRHVCVKSVDSLISSLCLKFGIPRGPGHGNVMVRLAREALRLGVSRL